MVRVLKIDSSILGEKSLTRKLTDITCKKLKEKYRDMQLEELDLTKDPIPHLTANTFQAFIDPTKNPSHEMLIKSNALIKQLVDSDIVVIGVPMYNFNIPTTLSTWIDHISRAKITFKFTSDGPVGLLPKNKKTILCFGMAGVYGENDKPFTAFAGFMENKAQMNIIEIMMKMHCAFIGLDDIYIIKAEGTAFDPKEKAIKYNSGLGFENAVKKAESQITKLINGF
jgi:FMN-dependent NADH-azoreductase